MSQLISQCRQTSSNTSIAVEMLYKTIEFFYQDITLKFDMYKRYQSLTEYFKCLSSLEHLFDISLSILELLQENFLHLAYMINYL